MRTDLERERFGSDDTDWPQLRARGISFSAFGSWTITMRSAYLRLLAADAVDRKAAWII